MCELPEMNGYHSPARLSPGYVPSGLELVSSVHVNRPTVPWAPMVVAWTLGTLACREPATHQATPESATFSVRPRSVPTSSPSANVAPRSDASDFIEQQMALRLDSLGPNRQPILPLIRGVLAQGSRVSHNFDVQPGHCYRIMAVGGVDVGDLDLVLYAPTGQPIASDTTRNDPFPDIGGTQPLCPSASGRYRIEVRMISGEGEYGLAVYGTP